MAEMEMDKSKLKDMIKLAKRKPITFAFNPGKTDAEHYLVMDKRKAPDVVGRAAKSDGPGSKVAFGKASVSGRLMELTCHRELPTLAKRFKKYLKFMKLQMNVIVLDVNGNVLEEDVENDLPSDPFFDDGSDESETETDVQDQDFSALARRLNALKDPVSKLPDPAKKKLAPPVVQAAQALKSGDIPTAVALMEKVEAALAKLGATQAPETQTADAKSLAARAKAMQSEIAQLPQEAQPKLAAALKASVAMIRDGKLAAADQALDRIEAALKNAPKTSQTSVDDSEMVALATRIRELRTEAADLPNQQAREKIETAIAAAVTELRAENTDAAKKLIARVEAALAKVKAPDSADQNEPSMSDVMPDVDALLDIWESAKAEMEGDISKLQNAMLKCGNPHAEKVAEFGLLGFTQGHNTKFMRSFIELRGASGDNIAKSKTNLRNAAAEYREFVKGHNAFDLFETNPLNVPVNVRGTIEAAMTKIEGALT